MHINRRSFIVGATASAMIGAEALAQSAALTATDVTAQHTITLRAANLLPGLSWGEDGPPASWARAASVWAPPLPPVFEPWAGRGAYRHHLVQISGGGTPQLAAVLVPKRITSGASVPVIFYFHPLLEQARASYAGQAYPNGVSYPWTALRYLYHDTYSPWIDLVGSSFVTGITSGVQWGSMGLAYQLAAGARDAVIVLPIGCLPGASAVKEFGSLTTTAGVLEQFTLGVLRAVLGSSSVSLGRLTLAAFSAGHEALIAALNVNASTALYRDNLAEIWCFDPGNTDRQVRTVSAVNNWRRVRKARVGAAARSSDRVVRLYSQETVGSILDGGTWGAGGGDWTTMYHCPATLWRMNPALAPYNLGWGHIHSLIPACFFTHAVRNSGY